MRYGVFILAGLMLCTAFQASAGNFNHDLKPRPPTIEILTPSGGQSVSPVDLTIRWQGIQDTKEFLGFAVENVDTGKRVFFGDAFRASRGRVSRTVEELRPGPHRIIGYHYGLTGDWTVAGIGPEFSIQAHQDAFWTKWDEPEKLCRHFAETDNYRIEDIKEITCKRGRCVAPKFYILVGSDWAILDDRASSLPEDKHIIKVKCLPLPDLVLSGSYIRN